MSGVTPLVLYEKESQKVPVCVGPCGDAVDWPAAGAWSVPAPAIQSSVPVHQQRHHARVVTATRVVTARFCRPAAWRWLLAWRWFVVSERCCFAA